MEVFAALADNTRRRIVEVLTREELLAGQVAAHFGGSRPAVSHHLRVLREAGLIRSRVDAQRRSWNAQLDRLSERVRSDLAAGDLPSAPKGRTIP
jgi:DNA-binding transcriptional ArsR family regulator